MEILKNLNDQRRILFVGEGNFSFSRHLVEHFTSANSCLFTNVVATCYESEETICEKARENVKAMEALGVEIRFNFDVTKEKKMAGEQFDLVIFMFPHVGGKMKIHKNRELLKYFAINIVQNLTEQAKVIVTLCNGNEAL